MTTDRMNREHSRGAPDRSGRAGCRWALLLLLFPSVVAGCGDEGAGEVALIAEETAEAEEGTVHLDSAALALSGVIVDSVTRVEGGALPVTGRITYDQDRVSHIGPKTQGRVVELMVQEGSRVGAGQVLAHLESPEVGSIRAELHEAEALLEIARENFEREQRLEAQGISSRRELLDAEAEFRREQARLRSAEERLRVLGASLHGDGGHFDVTSPYEGVVVQRHAGRGEVMGPSDQLFTVADLSRLWIELDIYERDLVRVREGQDVQVTTAAWPGRPFRGTIVYVGDILDAERRTVRARVEVENDDEALKPGMFATAGIRVAEDGPGVLAVPSDAVQTVEGSTVVWVPGDEPGEFLVRPVQVGRELPAGLVEITAGLEAGDRLVVEGAFTLKSELAKGEFGAHGH